MFLFFTHDRVDTVLVRLPTLLLPPECDIVSSSLNGEDPYPPWFRLEM
jgi:hypothetical protein